MIDKNIFFEKFRDVELDLLKKINQAYKHQKNEINVSDVNTLIFEMAAYYSSISKEKSIKIYELVNEKSDVYLKSRIQIVELLEKNINNKKKILLELEHLEKLSKKDLSFYIGRKYLKFNYLDKAVNLFKRYRNDYPQDGRVLPYLLRAGQQLADWELCREITQIFRDKYEGGNFHTFETPRTHLLWCDNQAWNIEVASKFSKDNFKAKNQPRPIFSNKKKIRIGYISYDYRDHPTSWLFMGLLRNHNRDMFEVYGYCLSYDDGSVMRREIQNRFDSFKHVRDKSDLEIHEIIKKDKIDILIDLNGLTEGSRYNIFTNRPASVIISYLGYPGSVGNRFIDYIIGDNFTITDELKKLYPEKVIRIPVSYQINDYRARYLPPKKSSSPHKIKENTTVIGIFNNVNKITDQVWGTWMEVISDFDDITIWILDPGPMAKENLINSAKHYQVNIDNFVFVPKLKQEAHIERLQWCDLMLDPWPYGGHTTTSDALFAGVPVITMVGSNFASRVSGGLLNSANLSELICSDIASYKNTFIRLLSQRSIIAGYKKFLSDNSNSLPIFDAISRTKHIESAYVEIKKRLLNKKELLNINVI